MAERDDEQASSNESVSGSVLRELFTNPIDQGYRPGAAMHADTGWKRFGMLLAVIALTTMAVWAALDLRDALTATDSPTRQLREEVETRLEYQALLQGNVDELRSGVDAEHELALPQDPAAAERSLQLRIASSAIPVEGPGITITLDDSHATTTNGAPVASMRCMRPGTCGRSSHAETASASGTPSARSAASTPIRLEAL